MPVNVPNGLPAIDVLRKENVFLMSEERASAQDIRPLEIAIVNLMPTKLVTEVQLLRLLSNTPLQVQLTLVTMGGHISRHTSAGHMQAFYRDSRTILSERFDGLIVTGAPVETLDFQEVDYWQELAQVLEWSKTNVCRSMFICWGVNAALHHFYGIERRLLPKKLSGIYPLTQHEDATSQLLLGLDDPFYMPQSRYTTVLPADIEGSGLKILASSPEAGAAMFASPDHSRVFVTGHLEYDVDTLDREYRRDLAAGLDIEPPTNYYKDDDPSKPPVVRWRSHAHQFFANWLNYYVYQETPYDLSSLVQA
jgi:homoserine O-succinyltransferase